MRTADTLASGKTHRDENFPVASFLIAPHLRAPILAFYRFARTADDVADHPSATRVEKLGLLETMRATLVGDSDASPEACELRAILNQRNLCAQHALDLLEAFRRDVSKLRYDNWAELMDYCRYSAMPVGRFVLDVHGEARATWPASDALCAALQVINHLQDCGKDLRDLDRLYIPLDALVRNGAVPEDAAALQATPGFKRTIVELAGHCEALLAEAKSFASQIADFRLALEVSVIQRLAEDLTHRLATRDPLSQRMHHNKSEAVALALAATANFLATRPRARKTRLALAQHP